MDYRLLMGKKRLRRNLNPLNDNFRKNFYRRISGCQFLLILLPRFPLPEMIFDMKAGLAQIIFSLRAIRDLELEVSVIPQIMITSDEEIGSPESETFITQIAAKADRAFVLEPSLESAGQLKTA